MKNKELHLKKLKVKLIGFEKKIWLHWRLQDNCRASILNNRDGTYKVLMFHSIDKPNYIEVFNDFDSAVEAMHELVWNCFKKINRFLPTQIE